MKWCENHSVWDHLVWLPYVTDTDGKALTVGDDPKSAGSHESTAWSFHLPEATLQIRAYSSRAAFLRVCVFLRTSTLQGIPFLKNVCSLMTVWETLHSMSPSWRFQGAGPEWRFWEFLQYRHPSMGNPATPNPFSTQGTLFIRNQWTLQRTGVLWECTFTKHCGRAEATSLQIIYLNKNDILEETTPRTINSPIC